MTLAVNCHQSLCLVCAPWSPWVNLIYLGCCRSQGKRDAIKYQSPGRWRWKRGPSEVPLDTGERLSPTFILYVPRLLLSCNNRVQSSVSARSWTWTSKTEPNQTLSPICACVCVCVCMCVYYSITYGARWRRGDRSHYRSENWLDMHVS